MTAGGFSPSVSTGRRWTLAGALVGALLGLTGCGEGGGGAARTPRSVLLVVVDSLRADRLGPYGHEVSTSPFLDRLATEGVVFEQAWAPSSFTSQSVAALMTGRLPSSGGSIGLMEAEPSVAATTLQQRFRRAGFRTGIVSSQPLLRRQAFTRGFEDIQVAPLEEHWPATDVAHRALDFVDATGDDPFFLYVHLVEPHQPYDSATGIGVPEINFAAGHHWVSLREVTRDSPAEKVWHVVIDDPRGGWAAYRAERVASLYPELR